MAYTARELITRALYESGIVSQELETASGQEISDGLSLLNDLLGLATADKGMVPYETEHDFTLVAGQEEYTIDDCISIDTLTFIKDDVRYGMRQEKRNEYQGSFRTNSINSLPYSYYFERQLGGGTLYLYFSPDQNYAAKIYGVFQLSSVTLDTDLELTYDRFYITYLRHALADMLCAEYALETPQRVLRLLARCESNIRNNQRKLDLRIQKNSTLQGPNAINYGQVNLGKGWY